MKAIISAVLGKHRCNCERAREVRYKVAGVHKQLRSRPGATEVECVEISSENYVNFLSGDAVGTTSLYNKEKWGKPSTAHFNTPP